jgi:ubiquitin C-terminal hydrolase
MFNRGASSARKVFAEVSGLGSFTLNFESSDRTMTKERYLLRAVIDHVGDSQDRGHYISYARRNIHHTEAGQDARLEWFKFDDSAFTQVTEADVLSSMRYAPGGTPQTPYVFLYQRERSAAAAASTSASLPKRLKHGE